MNLEGNPKVGFADAEGGEFEMQADFLVAAEGARSHCLFQTAILKENVAEWDDDQIWAEFCSRVNGNGFELKEGPVIEMLFCRSAASSTPHAGRATSFAPSSCVARG